MSERTEKPWWTFFTTTVGGVVAGVIAGGLITLVVLRPQAVATALGRATEGQAQAAAIEQAGQAGAQQVMNLMQPQLDQIKATQQTQQHQLDLLIESALNGRQLARGR